MAKKKKEGSKGSQTIASIHNTMQVGPTSQLRETITNLGPVAAQVDLTKHMFSLDEAVKSGDKSIAKQTLMDISIYAGMAADAIDLMGQPIPMAPKSAKEGGEPPTPRKPRAKKKKATKGAKKDPQAGDKEPQAPAGPFDHLTKANMVEILTKLGKEKNLPSNTKKVSREILVAELKKNPISKVAPIMTKMGLTEEVKEPKEEKKDEAKPAEDKED